MKHHFQLLALCTWLAIFVLVGSSTHSLDTYRRLLGRSFNGPPRRSLLSDSKEPETALIAGLDGTVHLLNLDSMKSLWSFDSGPTIYSSYQAPLDEDNKENAIGTRSEYYIDCDDDWELYAHSKLGKVKLMRTLEEYISSTPQIAEDGGVVLGSKQTTAFLVDAKTGRLICTYEASDSLATTQNNSVNHILYNTTVEERGASRTKLKDDELPLYITRTDYLLTSFAPDSNKVLWNMTVAEIGAAFLCQDTENSSDGALLDSKVSKPDFNMPLPCQSKALIYRFRNHDMLESFSRPSGVPGAHHQEMMLTSSIDNDIKPSQPNLRKVLEFSSSLLHGREIMDSHHENTNEFVLPLPSMKGNAGSQVPGVKISSSNGQSRVFDKLMFPLIFSAIILVAYANYVHGPLARRLEWIKLFGGKALKSEPPKKKRARKSGKIDSSTDKRDKHPLPDGEISKDMGGNFLLNLNQQTAGIDGRTIGKLFVSNKEIAKGSNGTVVLEGIYEGRLVAVKRLVRAHHDIAFKEIQNLIASDHHKNIVRWYGVEQDQDFVYLSLERCICNMNDLIDLYADNQAHSKILDAEILTVDRFNLDSLKVHMQDVRLWMTNGYPSPVLLELMRDVVSGLVHLHELGIMHRDLKPQNILIVKGRPLCAKLSDMGISKRLAGDTSSLGQHATGYGSSGWQAPEQLLCGRQTRAVDLFSLGCVLFYCITGGRHPFGSRLERDINIVKNKVDLFFVEYIPEAVDLFSHLLNPVAELRPKAAKVLIHPLFWSAETRLSFLLDSSDRVELEDRDENGSLLLKAIESTAPLTLAGRWDEKLEPTFLDNIWHYRRYKFDSVRDLLRVIRNKRNHYRELPAEVQEILGPVPDGYEGYFRSRFPKLLIEVYKVMSIYCREDDEIKKYFEI